VVHLRDDEELRTEVREVREVGKPFAKAGSVEQAKFCIDNFAPLSDAPLGEAVVVVGLLLGGVGVL
jgi:hypothetical protein